MKTFFRYLSIAFNWFWRSLSFIRQLLINLIFIGFVISFFIIITYDPATEKKAMTGALPHALLLNITGPIVEKRQPIAPFDLASRNLLAGSSEQENLLFDIVDQIRSAAKDKHINGIILKLEDMPETNLTKLRYIAKALSEFKQEGKKIIAISGFYTQSQYYLASFADEIYMAKDGAVLLQGFSAYRLYFKDFLEKLNISTHVFRVGEYKSAIEPYTRINMSPEARESNTAWLAQLWKGYLIDVARNRDIKPESLSPDEATMLKLMQEAKGDTAVLAKNLGLVDELLNMQEIRSKLAAVFGSNGLDSTNYISMYDYPLKKSLKHKRNRVAVVVVDGMIVDGIGETQQAGGDTIASLLREARLDDNIKAVVLRIDSPGGSAFASEVIRNEVEALKQAGKPIVASMSSVAASGGYWIASSADSIIAQPTTITGSIGIFGLLTTFDKTLAKYGIFNDGIGTTPLAGIGLTRELPESAQKLMQLGIENGYQRFISLVSEQRAIPLEQMNNLAQGRVWTGADAIGNKLIDKIGDFDTAVDEAANLAKIDFYSVEWLQESLSPAQALLIEFFSEAMLKLGITKELSLPTPLEKLTTKAMKEMKQFSSFNDPNGRYIICSECITY